MRLYVSKINNPIVWKKKAPIKYPITPPKTELVVHIIAYIQDFALFDIIIRIKIMSGGIGKIELSIKEINAKNQLAFG